jgi:indoleamine 2,3-dioxygenase
MIIPNFTDGFFNINSTYGFLPVEDPIEKLPINYSKLQFILDNMCIKKDDNESGFLLDEKQFLEECSYLPDYSKLVENENNVHLIAALYRSYCFLASAYLLQPSYKKFVETGHYGVARSSLPVNISNPLIKTANILNVFPFLEYSYGYSLGNYVRIDKNAGLEWDNLKMANKFSGMLDEAGFIMVHVDINRHTPKMIGVINNIIKIVYDDNLDIHDETKIEQVASELNLLVKVLKDMNNSRKQMWKASRSSHYNDFRVFIMGIKGNTDIFPNGVIYEPEIEPRYYRGQSGSQDTIIPFLDTVFGIDQYYPNNILTSYLLNMRDYRPKPFRDLLDWCKNNLGDFASRLLKFNTLQICTQLFKIYREIYRFRNGHWQFVQMYIMENTKYPTATGGTPITTWIPNQITATLDAIQPIFDKRDNLIKTENQNKLCEKYVTQYQRMRECLNKQIQELSNETYNTSKVYNLNTEYKLNDI